MSSKIQIKRGAVSNIPTLLDGEFGYCTDTNQLYIGNNSVNKEIATKEQLDDKADRTALNATNANVTNLQTTKADKSEITGGLTYKGSCLYASLPTTGNATGDYWYCSDGTTTDGAGNYCWNGTAWYYGGDGNNVQVLEDEISELKEDLVKYGTKVVSANIINQDDFEDGYLNSAGVIESSNYYKTTNFIEIAPNTDYHIHSFSENALDDHIRRTVLLYDDAKNPISATFENLEDAITFNSGSYKYARVCWEKAYDIQMSIEDLQTFIPYSLVYENTMNIGNYTTFGDKVIPIKAIEDGCIVKCESIDLFDIESTEVGCLCSDGSINATLTYYRTINFIKIKKGLNYTIHPKLRMIAFYDENKNIISDSFDSEEKYEPFTFSKETDCYCRFTYNPSHGTPSVTSVGNVTPTKKLEEGYAFSNQQLKSIETNAYNQNVLYGKKWVVVGDSFSNNSYNAEEITDDDYLQDGMYKGKLKLYQYFIGNRNLMEVVPFTEGGKTMATPSVIQSHNCFTDVESTKNYTLIPADADYITIWLGINDSHCRPSSGGGDGESQVGVIPLGTIDDTTINTFYGAWNVAMEYLIEQHPYAKIGIIVTNGAETTEYADAEIEIAKKWGIAYLDLNGDYKVPLMHRVNGKSDVCARATELRKSAFWVSQSNGHPNSKAHEYQSTFIEYWLRSL